jgi:hypothetical protein
VAGDAEFSVTNTAQAAVPEDMVDPAPGNDSASDRNVIPTVGVCGVFEERALSAMTVSTPELYQACSRISAGPGFEIVAGGDVTFRAGQEIALHDGFAVDGGLFTAEIAVPTPP